MKHEDAQVPPADAGRLETPVRQHTLGPWRFNQQMGEPWTISDANGHSLMGDEQYYPWVPGDEADWHLIAAAPELLAFAQWFLENRDGPGRSMAQAAVDKAVGAALRSS
jgi:hypothetical protein